MYNFSFGFEPIGWLLVDLLMYKHYIIVGPGKVYYKLTVSKHYIIVGPGKVIMWKYAHYKCIMSNFFDLSFIRDNTSYLYSVIRW